MRPALVQAGTGEAGTGEAGTGEAGTARSGVADVDEDARAGRVLQEGGRAAGGRCVRCDEGRREAREVRRRDPDDRAHVLEAVADGDGRERVRVLRVLQYAGVRGRERELKGRVRDDDVRCRGRLAEVSGVGERPEHLQGRGHDRQRRRVLGAAVEQDHVTG